MLCNGQGSGCILLLSELLDRALAVGPAVDHRRRLVVLVSQPDVDSFQVVLRGLVSCEHRGV